MSQLPILPPDSQPVVPSLAFTTSWRQYFVQLDRLFRRVLATVGTGATTVADLPNPATLGAGARAFVTDANATTYLSTVAGGGSNKVPVVSDGTNWLIG